MAALGQISNVYDDQPYQDFANLSRGQAQQSLNAGDRAAAYADPFMGERSNYQKRLRDLISNPGSQESSPFFKYLMETQMNQVNANNAARGLSRSGRGAMALQDRAAGVATQSYFPQVAALTQLAQGGSNPGMAGGAYALGIGRSQDQQQMAAFARAAGQQRSPQAPPAAPVAPAAAPSSGAYSGGYSPSFGLPYSDYMPSSAAGTGYVMSDYGASDVNGPGSQYYSYGGEQAQPQQPAYDPYAQYDQQDYGSDFGYGGDYG